MDNQLLKEYADIKLQLAALEARRKEIEVDVIESIDSLLYGQKEIKTPFGKFSIGSRKSYKYSPSISRMQDEVYQAKKQEEASGAAELMKDSQFPVFTPNKEDRLG